MLQVNSPKDTEGKGKVKLQRYSRFHDRFVGWECSIPFLELIDLLCQELFHFHLTRTWKSLSHYT